MAHYRGQTYVEKKKMFSSEGGNTVCNTSYLSFPVEKSTVKANSVLTLYGKKTPTAVCMGDAHHRKLCCCK